MREYKDRVSANNTKMYVGMTLLLCLFFVFVLVFFAKNIRKSIIQCEKEKRKVF